VSTDTIEAAVVLHHQSLHTDTAFIMINTEIQMTLAKMMDIGGEGLEAQVKKH
jgi:hypothetical protein